MKGRTAYIPIDVRIEINKLKEDLKLQKDSDAFKFMVHFSRVGRQLESPFDNKRKRKGGGLPKWL